MELSEQRTFFRQLHALFSSGVGLANAISLLAESSEDIVQKSTLESVRKNLDSGFTLSQSLSFADIRVSRRNLALIKLGEESGGLSDVLQTVSTELEEEMKMRSQVRAATIYPLSLALISLLSVVGLVWFFLPRMLELIESLDSELPWLLATLLWASKIVFDPLILFVLLQGILGLGLSWKKLRERPDHEVKRDRLLLEVPVLGQLLLELNTYHFCAGLAALLRCGCPMVQALELVGATLSNRHLENVISEANQDIKHRGYTLSESLRETGVFPRSLPSFLACAEESGSLESVLDVSKQYHADRVQNILDQSGPLLEAAVLVIMGGIVGITTVALFMPMVKVLSTL